MYRTGESAVRMKIDGIDGTSLLVVTLLATSASALAGQSPGGATVRGLVVDSVAGTPVSGVLLRLDSGGETFSARDGSFLLLDVPPGEHMIAALTSDCRVTWTEVTLEEGGISELRVTVPTVPGTEVVAERERSERRRAGGRLVTAEEIREMNAVTLADVIRRVEPNMVGAPTAVAGEVSSVEGRARNSFLSASGKEEPVVLIDGVRAVDGARALADLLPSEVETLELQPGASGGWEYGSAGAAGIIRVTTRRHSLAVRPARAEPCTVPSFPIGPGR